MPRRHLLVWSLLVAFCLGGLVADAQSTGGSMGGSGFSGSGSSGSSSSGSSSSSSYGSSSGGGSTLDGRSAAIMMGVLVLSFLLLAFAAGKAQPPAGTSMVLSSLVLGIDWNARREIQAKLMALAARRLGGTPEGRAEMLREVVL